jgi:hypothetical protein
MFPYEEMAGTDLSMLTRAEAYPEEEEEEGDGMVSGRLIAATKLAHEWVGVSSLPLVQQVRLVAVEVVL